MEPEKEKSGSIDLSNAQGPQVQIGTGKTGLEALDDRALIRQCQQNDPDAFNELIRRHQRGVFNLAYRLSGTHEEANDLTVETFIRALSSINDIKNDTRLNTWLYRIAAGTHLDTVKKRKAHESQSSLDELRNLFEFPDDHPGVMEALNKLPDYQRIICFLYYGQHMSFEEIADLCSLPLGTVKSRLNRAKQALQMHLEEPLPPLEDRR